MLALLGVGLVVAACVGANVSITGSSDSPCGSIVAERAVWATGSSCGIAHRGTLAVAASLCTCGVGALVVAARIAVGRRSGRGAVGLLAGVCVLGSVGTIALVWRVAAYEEPVLRRGWVAVRDLVASSTLALGLAAAMVGAALLVDGRRSG